MTDEKKYIMAIDEGTTSARAILFDKKGNNIGSSQKELRNTFRNRVGSNIMPMRFGMLSNL